MTDKPEPTVEHIDAVARAIADADGFLWPDTEKARDVWRARAHVDLAANLPTDVMLTALVERGALSEEQRVGYGSGVPDHRRRLVTPWEPTP